MNEVSHSERSLQTAAAQPEPQRLFFVFAAAGLPEDATASQRRGGRTINGLLAGEPLSFA